MYKKIILILCICFGAFIPTLAHDFNQEAFEYILNNPDATWTDFESQVETFDDPVLEELMADTEAKITVALSMNGKEYINQYVEENPDFTYTDIKNLIADDPMFSEIGSEILYSFLSERFQTDTSFISLDFFIRFIQIGLEHILSGIDHILFILTLIVCLPRMRRILSVITTFTVAHCLTIVLGGLGIITVASSIVEPMIVGSIILMAIYALFQKVGQEKKLIPEIVIIFILGLFHGLGFAGFFQSILDTSSNIVFPIFAFNIGVEIGQIIIILIALFVLKYLYRFAGEKENLIKNIFSTISIVIASYWLIQMFV